MSLSDYALVLIFCVVVTAPLDIFFKLGVYANIKTYLKAVAIPALFFIVWDVFATHYGHWAFSKEHTSTFRVFGLPIEEYLFFVVIPLCAVLSLETIRKINPNFSSKTVSSKIWLITIAAYFVIGTFVEVVFKNANDIEYPARIFPYYTLLTFSIFAITMAVVLQLKSTKVLIGKLDYYFALLICYFFMIFVNGYLTKLTDPVVTYGGNWGPRVFFNIPVEDFFYGGILLIWTMLNYDRLKARNELVNS